MDTIDMGDLRRLNFYREDAKAQSSAEFIFFCLSGLSVFVVKGINCEAVQSDSGKNVKACDWINLKKVRIINDRIGEAPLVLVLSNDNQSFAAFERPSESENFLVKNDTLFVGQETFNFSGRNLNGSGPALKRLKTYQEFWHSWKEFHPKTEQYK